MPLTFSSRKRVHVLAGYFYLSSTPQHISAPVHNPTVSVQQGEDLEPIPPINDAVHILCTIIKNVIASATEAEIKAVFRNAQDAVMLRQALEYMGYPQPATSIEVDNEYPLGILTVSVKQRRSKAIDMRFY